MIMMAQPVIRATNVSPQANIHIIILVKIIGDKYKFKVTLFGTYNDTGNAKVQFSGISYGLGFCVETMF